MTGAMNKPMYKNVAYVFTNKCKSVFPDTPLDNNANRSRVL